ncbi:porin family protein [Winogradskyella sp. SYSU M77433]|uniref:porin family protein n=1 Tax=Winogradskyella sp. SYSU M77433 TaxID=3042722 RepID=UPI0024816FA4|nr:porin family protein [Winogradskyella sp. SYSU M77433]MDH7914413.1 porin family protein [Winogradskyella sp. SYSU M77433]
MKNLQKTLIASLVMVFIGLSVNAQRGSAFGIKGGLNYGANGDYFESIGDNAKHPDRNLGYHLGLFGKIGDKFYFRPELVYTATKSDYDNDDFQIKKLDAPLLVGIKVLGPVSVFAGPSLQYILDTEFDGISIDDVEDDFSVGLNFGIGLNFNKIGLDLRYERGFNDNEATFINDNIGTSLGSRIDTRPDQLILSLSIAL